ncbi:hypothetical protein BC937DRAFT_88947 [Endogone sp. FLAS-F59071]|nr:hypothetical protein BC937DRAFT_88947 [Endogone sp. FLAS-F59071]|eukprot:RUS18298.1 hypothetical protein BC937DRAFT_88947 [Endogone sp. FLAS-F59071]
MMVAATHVLGIVFLGEEWANVGEKEKKDEGGANAPLSKDFHQCGSLQGDLVTCNDCPFDGFIHWHLAITPMATSNEITVLYFASAQDATGLASEVLALSPDPLTLASLTELLVLRHGPALKHVLEHSLYAVNMDYVEKERETDTWLLAGDEVAIIPPVSGG